MEEKLLVKTKSRQKLIAIAIFLCLGSVMTSLLVYYLRCEHNVRPLCGSPITTLDYVINCSGVTIGHAVKTYNRVWRVAKSKKNVLIAALVPLALALPPLYRQKMKLISAIKTDGSFR